MDDKQLLAFIAGILATPQQLHDIQGLENVHVYGCNSIDAVMGRINESLGNEEGDEKPKIFVR